MVFLSVLPLSQIGQILKNKNLEGRYVTGEAVSLGFAVCAIVLIIAFYPHLKRQNTTRHALGPEERKQWIDEGMVGDAHPDFRYML
jgi:hypothetical protein